MAKVPKCEHCGAAKLTDAGLCPKCYRFGTPTLNRLAPNDPRVSGSSVPPLGRRSFENR